MDVLQQHQERVGHLRQTLDQLIGLHRDLHTSRNTVLATLAKQRGPRQAVLPEIRGQIREISRQIDTLRSEVFGARPGVAGTLARSLVDSFDESWNIWLSERRGGATADAEVPDAAASAEAPKEAAGLAAPEDTGTAGLPGGDAAAEDEAPLDEAVLEDEDGVLI